MGQEDKILFQFIDESLQNLQEFERDLFALEANLKDLQLIQSLYRNLHTIKGGIGFFSIPRLELFVHKSEELFNTLSNQSDQEREANLKNYNLLDLFFKIADHLLSKIKALKKEKPEDLVIDDNLLGEIDKSKQLLGNDKSIKPRKPKRKLSALQQKALAKLNPRKPEPLEEMNLDENIIIKPETLEVISQLNSELLLARNQMSALLDEQGEAASNLTRIYGKIDNLSQRILERIDQIRLQPVSLVTDKLKRITRDLSKQFAKEINLVIIGEDLEVDRTVLEAIKDPLIHIIRNSIDHGVETTAVREAINKPIPALIKIEVKYTDNKFFVLIEDDGAGIDSDKVLAKAIDLKLLTQEEAKQITENELFDLIFHPGFSTAGEVSTISGRGVGLDVVKTNISKINGSIEVRSQKGLGTSFSLLLPMTLASETALVFETAGHKFALSQNYIQTIGILQPEDLIDAQYIELDEEKIELLDFNNIFVEDKSIASLKDNQEYMLIEAEDCKYALLIDSVLDLQNIVIKTLPDSAFNLDLYSGSTILADGSVALILSANKLYQVYKHQHQSYRAKQFFNLNSEDVIVDKVVSFRLGEFKFALDYHLIQEISTTKSITKLPGSDREGLINLHDNVILTKDLPSMIGLVSKEVRSHVEIIVKLESNTFAIQADDIDEILSIDDEIEQCPIDEELIRKYARRAYLFQDKPLYLLDETKILSAL